MVNLTPNEIVYNVDGQALDIAIRTALSVTTKTLLSLYDMNNVSLDSVTTKTNVRAAFAKFVVGRVLPSPSMLGREYVAASMRFYSAKNGAHHIEDAEAVLRSDPSGAYAYKTTYATVSKLPVGLFLVALHSSSAITLPVAFNWPSARAETADGRWVSRRREVANLVSSELLNFVRSLDSQSESVDPAFDSVGGDKKRREWFLTYGTKLLLATGWHRPEDVNLDELASIKDAEDKLSANGKMPLAYKALLEVLKSKFGQRMPATINDWVDTLRTSRSWRPRAAYAAAARGRLAGDEQAAMSVDDLLSETLQMEPDWARVENLRGMVSLPGLNFDMRAMSATWLDLEDLYVEKTKRESYKPILGALKWWNMYLFYYLPYWFGLNPDSKLVFPSEPKTLVTSVFVSRLLPTAEARPMTFVEFMDAQSAKREWAAQSHYANLLNLEGFFNFIERYSEEIPSCYGFRQPLAPHDYPRIARTRNTKKQPVPRRFFGAYLDFHETLLAHLDVVLEKILSGEISRAQAKRLVANGDVIDTLATSNIVGFVPVMFTATKTLRLQFIPNVLDMGDRTLRDGRKLMIPHPHSLHQNLTALHTGIRHNHIQWLDRDRFDCEVSEDDGEYARLYVNTDKQKTEAWTPHVHRRVIELLTKQRDWVELIGEDGFHGLHFYNDNPDTKWPKFRPLFAYTSRGLPHGDAKYAEVWQLTLMGLQGLVPALPGSGRVRRLLTLLPPGFTPSGDLGQRLVAYGAQFGMGEHCPLRPWTLTTPHSARVAVVSQYVTFLPTDMIGNWFTAQKSGTVSYYVKLDEESIHAEQAHQAMRLRQTALRTGFEPVLSGTAGAGAIHADAVNSQLARSLQEDVDGTLVRFGGMSIMFSEHGKHGVDILRETKGANVAFNKTEICPFGNECPPEIVKAHKGLRKCGLCQYAVRTVDHLPAVVVKERQMMELVDEIELVLRQDELTLDSKFTPEELDDLEAKRLALCEELTGWVLSDELLEAKRQQLLAGKQGREWLVGSPEILEQGLQRVSTPVSATEYLLLRLGDCTAYPSLETPLLKARFDLLRRELLARAGDLKSAFNRDTPVHPAAECAGLLRSIVDSTGMSMPDLAAMLENDTHLAMLPSAPARLLAIEAGE